MLLLEIFSAVVAREGAPTIMALLGGLAVLFFFIGRPGWALTCLFPLCTLALSYWAGS